MYVCVCVCVCVTTLCKSWVCGSQSQLDEDTEIWQMERVGRWNSLAAPLYPTSLASLSRHVKAVHLPGYLATLHLARRGCQATGPATIIQAPVWPIPLLSSHLPLSLSFHSSHLRSLPSFSSTQYFIWQLTLYQPLYWSMDYQHILLSLSSSFSSLSLFTEVEPNHA